MRTRLLLVDDHPLFRAGLRALVSRDPELEVAGEASTTASAIQIAETIGFDAALVDVVVPDEGGASVVRALRLLRPGCPILALSMIDDPIRVAQILRAGASGYALKSESAATILAALRDVLAGTRYLSPTIAVADVERWIAAKRLPLELLTARERHVFDLLVRGRTNANIASQLAIAQATVETHRRHIMRKLEADSIVDLVHAAVRHGTLGALASEPVGAAARQRAAVEA